jgi:hypothetical protein
MRETSHGTPTGYKLRHPGAVCFAEEEFVCPRVFSIAVQFTFRHFNVFGCVRYKILRTFIDAEKPLSIQEYFSINADVIQHLEPQRLSYLF